MIKAVIFDMDGLLVDSEPLWQQAEINIFSKIGVQLTREMCASTKGLRINEVVQHWYDTIGWEGKEVETVKSEIVAEVINLINAEASKMPGVDYILSLCKNKSLKLALASSSDMSIIEAVLAKLNLQNTFEVICSGEHEKAGKPAPDIFITAAKKLDIPPEYCLVFEDSVAGVQAADRAGMNTVAVPDSAEYHNEEFSRASLKISSLELFTDEHLPAVTKDF